MPGVSLERMRSTCCRTAPRAMPSFSAISRPVYPSTISVKTAFSREVRRPRGSSPSIMLSNYAAVLNVFDGEHDATYAQRVRRCVFRLSCSL
jgi:hypothetical protein